MARLSRLSLPGIPQHIIQRGTNRQACFGSDEDMAAYAAWLDEYARVTDRPNGATHDRVNGATCTHALRGLERA